MSKSSILDPRIKLRPSKKLLDIMADHVDELSEVPESISKFLTQHGHELSSQVITKEVTCTPPQPDLKLLRDILKDTEGNEDTAFKDEIRQTFAEDEKEEQATTGVHLNLSDLIWLNQFLTKLRSSKGIFIYLHEVITECELTLPENSIVERDPLLEARCQRLREEQANRKYRSMTKDVDSTFKHYPEDTIAYQMKALNSQIIAVVQFVFSVVAGFVFGFLGLELIIGNLDFGFRLLLGIMCALIIALAEIYFLAKKLNEYDNIEDGDSVRGIPRKSKPHAD